jgi:hypothetical protein
MSTLTSVISIALAVHIYQRDKEKTSREFKENDRRHNQVIGFLAWLCMLVSKLAQFASQLVKDRSQRQPQQPSVPRQERRSSPIFETDYPADRNSGPEPAAQGSGRQSDNISADLSSRRDITDLGPDSSSRVSQEVGFVRRTGRRRAIGDEEFESPSKDRSAPSRPEIRHHSWITRGIVASTIDAAALPVER